MDVPQDIDLKKIINKLAEFVARNGPDFEAMTKAKQINNPKFSFLYGGEYYNYYKYRVASEQNLLKQQSPAQQQQMQMNMNASQMNLNQLLQQVSNPPGVYNQPPPQPANTMQMPPNANNSSNNSSNMPQVWSNCPPKMNSGPPSAPPPPVLPTTPNPIIVSQIEALNAQQATLREQIQQSEKNLQAQHSALMQQQQTQIEEAVTKAQAEYLQKLAKDLGIDLIEFDGVLQPISDSCTKDSISTGKSWILQHTTDTSKCNVVLQYLLKKALNSGSGFSHKLHLIYLVNDVLHHCARKNVEELKNGLENIVIPMFCSAQIIATDEQKLKLTKLLSLWESKANFFDACVISKLRSAQSSMQEYKHNLMTTYSSVVNVLKQATKTTFDNYQQQHQAFIQHASQQITMLETQKQVLEQQSKVVVSPSPAPQLQPPPFLDQQQQIPSGMPPNIGMVNMDNRGISQPEPQIPQSLSTQYPGQQQTMKKQDNEYNLPPPGNFLLPDLSKPPPGFNLMAEPPEEEPIPTPYFELPAGLMVPLIRLEEYRYRPLDPSLIKLPTPTPPNERLLGAVDAFYSPPSHERPRDGDGWEKLALYEYYKVKNQAKKQKEEELENGKRDRSRSPSPILLELQKTKKSNKRRYRSKSRSRSRSRSPEAQRKPIARRRHSKSPPSRSTNSPIIQKRSSPPPRREKPMERERFKERERSISPPSFLSYPKPANESIEESNKGHQMLLKMGWGGAGTGLGVGGQGIDKPIDGGEVRDRKDQYKGVGISLNDPYENFRKNKGAAFITRMKARAEERS